MWVANRPRIAHLLCLLYHIAMSVPSQPSGRRRSGLFRPRPYNRPAHLAHMIANWAAVILLSLGAVFYALGYEINWAAKSIRQTSILSLTSSGVQSGEGIAVSLNGKPVADRLPLRMTHVFPGNYDLALEKPGYQRWRRTVRIEPNQAVTFRSLLLLRDNPLPVAIPVTSFQDSQVPGPQVGIQIQENELYIREQFITRTSQDISSAQWYPDEQHVVYQAGDTIWLSDLDGLNSQLLVRLPAAVPVAYYFAEGGRTFFYRTTTEEAFRISIL